MIRYYKRDGSHYPEGEEGIQQWSRDMLDMDKKIVRQDHLDNKIMLSTVWLGFDYGGGAPQPPLIFETMILSGGPYNESQWRYSTEEEALKNHIAILHIITHCTACGIELTEFCSNTCSERCAAFQILNNNRTRLPD